MELRILIEPQEGASYDDQLAAARMSEDLGFDGFFRTDHLIPLGLGRGSHGEPSETWMTLGMLGRDTTRIRLGTLVTAATFRPPGLLAMQVAQADAASGGRIELGLGAGWYEREHRAFGIPYPDLPTRFDCLEEQLQIVRAYWETASGDTFTFAGAHYRLVDCPALPRPAQGAPPIIVGGKGKPRGLRLAAQYADEFNLEFPRPGAPAAAAAALKAALARAGRDPGSIVFSAAHLACVGRDRAELQERADRAGLDLSLRLGGMIGTVDEVRADLAELERHGVTRFYLQVPDLRDLDHIRRLSELL